MCVCVCVLVGWLSSGLRLGAYVCVDLHGDSGLLGL